jgi:hypothetical protein
MRYCSSNKRDSAMLWGSPSGQGLLGRKSAHRLAAWWVKHAEELPTLWPLELLLLVDRTSVELKRFQQDKSEGSSQSYLKAARTRQDLKTQIVLHIEEALISIDHLLEELGRDERGIDSKFDLSLLADFFKIALRTGEELHSDVEYVRLRGRGAAVAEGAERGRVVRRLGALLRDVPPAICDTFIADVLNLLGFGTRFTRQTVGSILEHLRPSRSRK